MRFWAGVTDLDWFNFLHGIRADEVNFWRPSAQAFGAIGPGAPFLFKLKDPRNVIGGVGFFVSSRIVPISVAWRAFREKNGFQDYEAFRRKIVALQRRANPSSDAPLDPLMGCNVLGSVTFFSDEEQFAVPTGWKPQTVQGRSFDTADPAGYRLWSEVEARLASRRIAFSLDPAAVGPRYGSPALMRQRLGQGGFRIEVMEAYNRRCAVTGERTLPVLEAAHIRPYALDGPHAVENGIFLRSDLHLLFDLGYVTIEPKSVRDLRMVVSKRIRAEYENGRDYYALAGKQLVNLPSAHALLPARTYLEWHNASVFRD